MKTQFVDLVAAFLAGFAVMLLIAMALTTPNEVWRQQAIHHGAASYVCDPQTGKTEFRWKEQK